MRSSANPVGLVAPGYFVEPACPYSALFENLRAGASIEEFLDWFEGVDARQVQIVLDHELKSLSV